MKVAVVGSRGLDIDMMEVYIPAAATEIVSGGAKGVDREARNFAKENNLGYMEFLPDYEKYGRAAPIKRNDEIIDYADLVVAIWDSQSKGTKYVVDKCKKIGKSLMVFYVCYCEETGFTEIKHCEYNNMTALSHEMLKAIITAELDGETEIDIDVELINACIDAILTNKYRPIFAHIEKEQIDKTSAEIDTFIDKIIGKVNIDDNI